MRAGVTLVDLSVTLGPSPGDRVPVEVEYMSHERGGAHLAELVGMAQGELRAGHGWASERITAITHSGTHMDAPYHCTPVVQGQPARTIDELPLEWFWSAGCCIRVEQGDETEPVAPEELLAWERERGRALAPGEIVLFYTGAAAWHGTAQYSDHGRGLSEGLVRLLVERGIHVLGTDAWSIDPPYRIMRQRLREQGPRSVWAAHLVARDAEFCVLEKLCNLERLPPADFQVVCFPIKVRRGSAGWVRPVALVPSDGKDGP